VSPPRAGTPPGQAGPGAEVAGPIRERAARWPPGGRGEQDEDDPRDEDGQPSSRHAAPVPAVRSTAGPCPARWARLRSESAEVTQDGPMTDIARKP